MARSDGRHHWYWVGLLLLASAMCGPRRASAGETRCWIDKGALVVSAAFGDIAGDFVIDLSAPVSRLHDTRANSDGEVETTVTRDLRIGGERIAAVTLPVADLDAQTGRFDTTVNGVLGADLFRGWVVEFSPSPCRLGLSRGPGRRRPGATRLAVTMSGGVPLIPAVLSDGARVRPGLFSLGTARWDTRIARGRLARADADPSRVARLRAVEVAGRLFEQVPAVIGGDPSGEAAGTLGMAIWSDWRFRLDLRQGWIDLAPAS